jgi:hypothetical protein
MSAGLASAVAAVITSKFGVAGTLLGAALTTMIITGGSAILKAYLESVTGSVRKVPGRLRERRKAARYTEPTSLPGRPDLRDNFAGRMRAALGWFSNLPPLARRSILVKGLVGALIAFAIGMGVVYAAEKVINNNLSCGLWGNCPEGNTPGIHLGGGNGTGAAPTIGFGGSRTTNTAGETIGQDGGRGGGILDRRDPVQRQEAVQQDSGYQPPARQQDPSGAAPADPNVDPVEPVAPAEPAEPQDPVVEPGTPGAATVVPGQQPPADGAGAPATEDSLPDAQAVPAE